MTEVVEEMNLTEEKSETLNTGSKNGHANGDTNDEPPLKKQKTDADEIVTSEPTPLEEKIIRQIEYYFGDFNLPKDKFMQEKIKEDDGWIGFDVMLNFKRLASLTTDKDAIVKAISKSTRNLVCVNEDGTKLRRSPEFPIPEYNDEHRKELVSRTCYIKGFPLKAQMNEILAFFENHTQPENINMRFYEDKSKKLNFKGSIFATFKTIEECAKFLESGPYKYQGEGNDLILKWQEAYITEKRKEREEKKEALNKSKAAAAEKKEKVPECSVLHLSGFSKEDTTRENIAKKLEEMDADVAYTDYAKGDKEAYTRLGINDAANVMKEADDGKIEINGEQITIRILEGEEFDTYMDKIREMRRKRNQKTGKGGRGRRNRGNKRNDS